MRRRSSGGLCDRGDQSQRQASAGSPVGKRRSGGSPPALTAETCTCRPAAATARGGQDVSARRRLRLAPYPERSGFGCTRGRSIAHAVGLRPGRCVERPALRLPGPDDPVASQTDPRVAIAAIVQRDFQRVVVLKGGAQASPGPETLVNIPTRFTTDAPASYDIPLTLLGQPVTITATARRWTWHFGDGTTASTTAAGTDGRVEHTYRSAAPVGAHVVIEWSGHLPDRRRRRRCRSPARRRPSATRPRSQVKQARSELVHDST